MAKCFNVTGLCVPAKHYMVDLNERVEKIRKMVNDGDYFTKVRLFRLRMHFHLHFCRFFTGK